MDKKFQTFLNKFHKILGIDSKEAQAKAVDQFEQAVVQRVMRRFTSDFTKEERKSCEDFAEKKSKPTPEQQAKFLQGLRPKVDMSKLVEEETKELTKEYVTHLLNFANAEQKKKIKKAAEEFIKSIS